VISEKLARDTRRTSSISVADREATHAEAATRLGCSVSTLKRRLEGARERLGARLARRGLAGAGLLTALTALHAQAVARPPLDARLVDGMTSAVTAADALAEYPLPTTGVRADELARGERESQRSSATRVIVKLPTIAAVERRGPAPASRTPRRGRACVRLDDDSSAIEGNMLDAQFNVGR
jgi:hypothetical protein